MIESKPKILEALDYVGSKCVKPVTAYLIGGSGFVWHGLKDQTKDVDLCMDFQDANNLVSELRSVGVVESKTGVAGVQYLSVVMPKRSLTLQIFIRAIYSCEDFALIEPSACETLTCGNLTIRVPDVKTLVVLKDRQTHALYKEWQRLTGVVA